VSEYEREPTIATQVRLQTLAGDTWESHPAVIADLTREELWLAVDPPMTGALAPGSAVRIVLHHPGKPEQTADTIILWRIGGGTNVVGLRRPRLWDPPSRREHARARLSVPVYLKIDETAEPLPAMSSNIGVGGVFCSASLQVRIAQRLDVSVRLTPSQSFECQAEVARIDKDPDDPSGNQSLIGLHFLGLDQAMQASLAETLAVLAEGVDDEYVPRAWRPAAEEPWDTEAAAAEIAAEMAASGTEARAGEPAEA
jgi:hypothetical protein